MKPAISIRIPRRSPAYCSLALSGRKPMIGARSLDQSLRSNLSRTHPPPAGSLPKLARFRRIFCGIGRFVSCVRFGISPTVILQVRTCGGGALPRHHTRLGEVQSWGSSPVYDFPRPPSSTPSSLHPPPSAEDRMPLPAPARHSAS